jgi:plastocyanin
MLVMVVAGGALLLPATSEADTQRFKAAGSSSGDWSWDPVVRRIVKGDRIVWKNPTGTTHTVTAWKGSWSKDSTIASGETTARRFFKTGVFKFRCMIGSDTPFAHSTVSDGVCSGMCGTVRVSAP